jgi:hypothetical protein
LVKSTLHSFLALAVAKDGWWVSHGTNPGTVEQNSLSRCRKQSKKPNTCRIADVNGTSDFIKRTTAQKKQEDQEEA